MGEQRSHRLLSTAVLFAWPALLVGLDVWQRGRSLAAAGALSISAYAGSAAVSALFWAALLHAAARLRRATAVVFGTAFVLLATLSAGGQIHFFLRFHGLLNPDLCRFPVKSWSSQLAQLGVSGAALMGGHLPVLVLSVGLVLAARRVLSPSPNRARISAALAGGALGVAVFVPFSHQGVQPTTPDVLYLRSVNATVAARLELTEEAKSVRPEVRRPLPVPSLAPRTTPKRNVLLIVGESLRGDVQCLDDDPSCVATDATRKAMPNRVGLPQMRALATTTGISMSVLFTGLGPHESRETLHSAPLLFEYARAAGFDAAYFTSATLMFGNLHLWLADLPVSRFVTGLALDPRADTNVGAPDELLAERVLAELPGLTEPYFVVVQLTNTHFPYRVEPNDAPFQPSERTASPAKNQHFLNFYKNSVWLQDRALARFVTALRATPAGARTVLVFTPDHGEAFREHHQMGHSLAVYDEELLVGGWVDAPPGTLEERESESLRAAGKTWTYHADVTPTVLDLFGVWDDPALDSFKIRMLGTSLLRPERTTRALPITNCSALWSCSFENWGMLRQGMKLEARPWDPDWHCFDLESDPLEKKNLGKARCGDLAEQALGIHGRLPGKRR